jgi:hypothetical protein
VYKLANVKNPTTTTAMMIAVTVSVALDRVAAGDVVDTALLLWGKGSGKA